MKRNWRAVGLTAALLASGVAAYAVSTENGADATEHVPASPARSAVSGQRPVVRQRLQRSRQLIALDQLRRTSLPTTLQDPFQPTSWESIPAPPPSPVSLPGASRLGLPPLPFSYVGRLDEDNGQWMVSLVRGEQSYLVRRGETLDAVYRVEDIDGNKLVIRYLPLGARQTLVMGESS